MTDVPFPLLTSPGLKPQAAGGRLLNTYPEKLPASAGKPYGWFRVPGLGVFGTAPAGRYRGGVLVNNLFYGAFGNTIYSWTSAGGDGLALTGSISGTDTYVFAARNNNGTPDVVFVPSSGGAFAVNGAGTGIIAYPDVNVLNPNAVVFHRSFFIFTYGDGKTRSSNSNSTVINTLNNATAESKPDTLYRPVPLGNGQLLLCGSTTLEVWGGLNDSGYPFNYVSTIPRGIVGPAAIAGAEDGFGKGIFFVGDDFRVSQLDGYTCTPISNSDLDTLIEREPVKSNIRVGVCNSRGHGFVIVQGSTWCYVFDTTLNTWHERNSHLKNYWRGQYPIQAFGRWLCGDADGANLLDISANFRKEVGVNDRQTITVSATGGTFTLSFKGYTTGNIAFNAAATAVATALAALPSIGSANNIDCTGGPLNTNPVVVRFKDAQGSKLQPLITATSALTVVGVATLTIAHTISGVAGDPLKMLIETGPFGPFPSATRINEIELFLTKGASDALGNDPDETDVDVGVSISRNGGQNWTAPRNLKIGRQSITNGRVRSSVWGHAEVQGVRWRFEESAGLDFAFMGASQKQDVLR